MLGDSKFKVLNPAGFRVWDFGLHKRPGTSKWLKPGRLANAKQDPKLDAQRRYYIPMLGFQATGRGVALGN